MQNLSNMEMLLYVINFLNAKTWAAVTLQSGVGGSNTTDRTSSEVF